ncbi:MULTISPECIES: HlyD family efflux transporter periplasmic adaptor subunit [Novosphingobium]|uniref:HlyD family efflux transporter periplasmic adaptor subunit n=1 Tax=Novosphingobium sp. TaxID=1874826 RepID=UPI0012CF6293|nr:HlyD family efflux transporter periplasmic adaptor subunit [Novosphingobium sp.]MPS69357.1 HlyD family efflux transporter periplasmic adaptor subunit [Novosphingobium sp.]
MKKTVGAAIVVALVLAAAAIWWMTRSQKDPNEIVLHGNVDIRQVSLAFDGSGRVTRMTVEEGDSVKAGQVLAQLDTATLSLQADNAEAQVAASRESLLKLRNGTRPEELQQARARLAAARADAAKAADDLRRAREVSSTTQGRAVSAQELDQARNLAAVADARAKEAAEALNLAIRGPRAEDVAAADAQMKGTEAQLALLRHQVSQGELKAPGDAVVRSRLLEVGDMATPQKPVYELALTSPKWVRVYVEEADLGRVRMGMKARVTSDSFPDRPVAGTVGYISSVAEFTPKSVETESLRTALVYEVRVRVDDRNGTLRLGQPVTVRINTGAPREGHAR